MSTRQPSDTRIRENGRQKQNISRRNKEQLNGHEAIQRGLQELRQALSDHDMLCRGEFPKERILRNKLVEHYTPTLMDAIRLFTLCGAITSSLCYLTGVLSILFIFPLVAYVWYCLDKDLTVAMKLKLRIISPKDLYKSFDKDNQ